MRKIREELGPEAVILSNQRTAAGLKSSLRLTTMKICCKACHNRRLGRCTRALRELEGATDDAAPVHTSRGARHEDQPDLPFHRRSSGEAGYRFSGASTRHRPDRLRQVTHPVVAGSATGRNAP